MKRTFQSVVTSAAAFLGLCFFFPAAPAMAQGGLGTFHAFYTAANVNLSGDLIHLYTTTSGTWHYNDLTALTHSGPPYQGSPLTSFSDSPGEHVFYLNSDGGVCSVHVFQLFWQRSNSSWYDQDLTLAASSKTCPNISAGITSFADSNGEHLYYEGTDQHVHQLYWQSGPSWTDQDLTAISGSSVKPQNQSAMTGFADSYGEHVYYEGTDQHIHQLYWQSGPSWADQDLTLISGSSVTPQNQSPLTSFVDSFGEHALYLGTNQHAVQLFWTHSGGWVEQDLTAIAENGLLTPPAVGSPLISFWNSYGEHVYYLAQPEGSEDDILELCFCGGGIWILEDPTQHATGGPQHQAVIGSRITGATQVSSAVGDVFYLSIRTPGQQYIDIYDISGNSSGSTSWQIVDLNSLTSAPETAASVGYTNEALTSFVDPY